MHLVLWGRWQFWRGEFSGSSLVLSWNVCEPRRHRHLERKNQLLGHTNSNRKAVLWSISRSSKVRLASQTPISTLFCWLGWRDSSDWLKKWRSGTRVYRPHGKHIRHFHFVVSTELNINWFSKFSISYIRVFLQRWLPLGYIVGRPNLPSFWSERWPLSCVPLNHRQLLPHPSWLKILGLTVIHPCSFGIQVFFSIFRLVT